MKTFGLSLGKLWPFKPVKPGTRPGTLVADPAAEKTGINVTAYSPEEVVEKSLESAAGIVEFKDKWPVVWVRVTGLGDAEAVSAIGEMFNLHPLALEDALKTHQRAKVEEYEDNLFIVARSAHRGEDISTRQFSLFMGKNFLVTFEEKADSMLDPVLDRVRLSRGKIRRYGPDYLAYALLDVIVDHYFPVLEDTSDLIEEMEESILRNPTMDTVYGLHGLKRDLISLRRAIWPLRDALNQLIRDQHPLIKKQTLPYLRDCHDHIVQVVDLLENYRDMATGLTDIHLSSVSNRMNEVMKVLTLFASIFIPLTFIAGIYGMNFEYMPELKWDWGYPAALTFMLVLGVGMYLFFKIRKWV